MFSQITIVGSIKSSIFATNWDVARFFNILYCVLVIFSIIILKYLQKINFFKQKKNYLEFVAPLLKKKKNFSCHLLGMCLLLCDLGYYKSNYCLSYYMFVSYYICIMNHLINLYYYNLYIYLSHLEKISFFSYTLLE